jgi:hypothetical protein
MSKAGTHVIMGPRNHYGEFVADIAGAGQTLAIVKCVDDFGAAAEAKAANAKTLTIGRCNEGPHGEDMQAWEPQNSPSAQAAAAAYYALIKPKWQLNNFIDVWETFNEYSGNWTWQADFYIALMDLVEPDDFRLGLWSTSGGNPPLPSLPVPAQRYISPNEAKHLTIVERTPRPMVLGAATTEQPWEAIARACRRAKAHGNHILCVHEYAWSGLLKDSWGNGVVGRYEALHDYLVSVNADIPIAITECGQNGGGGFVGVTPFVADVAVCDMRWMNARYLVGVSMWTLGRWSNANFQDALPSLGDYIIAHPTPAPVPIDPPPPPIEPRRYDRVYHLLAQSAPYDQRLSVEFIADPHAETVGKSIDDAFITSPNLRKRTVHVWNIGDFTEFHGRREELELWVIANYPPLPEIIYRTLP